MLNRRTFSVATALGATLGAPWVHGQTKLEQTKLSIAVGGKDSLYYLPLTIAEQLGYFTAEGLDVGIVDFPGGTRALQAVVGGAADVCSGAFEHTINLQVKSQFFQAFVLQGRAPQIAIGVSTKTMPNYKGIADLKGKKIGVSAPGSSTNMVANLVLSQVGLRASDVSYVGIGVSASALNALRSGQVDVISNADPVMTMLEQKGDVKIISDTRTLKGTQALFGGLMPAACLYAATAYIQTHPNTCQALAHAIVHALKWLQTASPVDIVKTVPESYLLGDRALYLASFDRVREAIAIDGLVPQDGPKTALKAIAGFDPGVKVDKIDLGKLYTNDFARRAKERFQA